jgi:hypothetical protein
MGTMTAHPSPERRTDGYEPQVVHRRIHVGDTVRVTDGAQEGRTGTVTTLFTTSAEVRFTGDGDWTVPKRWLELISDGTGRVPEESSHTRQHRSDISDPAVRGERQATLVVVPQQARVPFVAERDRAEANGVRIGIDQAVKLVDTFRDTSAANGRDGVAAVLDEIMARLLGRAE